MNSTQGIILIMLGVLVLYLVWRDGILDKVGAAASSKLPSTPGASGESGLPGQPGAGSGQGAGGGGGGSW